MVIEWFLLQFGVDKSYKLTEPSTGNPIYAHLEVNKKVMFCKSQDELFQKGRDEVQHSTLKELMHQG
ncbi:hypothetical protein Syun_021742 [Stephania yunnanensis]|uniref:Uncharacterized protein n=1 Tax=Stephania yunnanensis TaxID=152371 RepID=A0AAP0IGY3_9MAGN